METKEPESTESKIAKRLHRHELPMGAFGLDLHPDNERAFAACMDGVYELSVASGDSALLYQHESYATNVVCIHENDQIISSGYDGALQWYDLHSRAVIRHVAAHRFWSWDLARAKNAPIVASVSGQYLAGSYDYRPQPNAEPSVRVYHATSGKLLHSLGHLPPVQAVAVSADGQRIGVGNLMGDTAVWDLQGNEADKTAWNTPDFTGFGIIKSHCQIGGIYAATFADRERLIVAGMGPMRDPMAGNGKQRWQCFDVSQAEPTKVNSSQDAQAGEGLMETLAMHPNGTHFVMGGRLRGGSWNVGLFELATNELVHSFKTETRVTKAVFSNDGSRLLLSGAKDQKKNPEHRFGVVDVYEVTL